MRVLAVLLLVACDPALTERSVEQTTDVPTITFNADWSITQSGTLVAGAPAKIVYDVNRLPNCRATYNGLPAWGIVASFNADGGWGHSANVTSGSATFTVPAGRELDIWFFNSDDHGCTGYDSDYGRNFHFQIIAPAIIHFRQASYAIDIDGVVRGGDDLMIDYELARAPWCRATYNGLQAWDITAYWRFDGGDIGTSTVTAVSDSVRESAPLRITAPADAGDFEIWFENTDRTGCHNWDSDFGRNFHFALQ